jgi:SRSO17 transposase
MNDLAEFERNMARLCAGLGHSDGHAGLRGYCTGLMAPLACKRVDPTAAHLAPGATRSRHRSRHHFVADSAWSDVAMFRHVAQWVVPAMDFSEDGWWIVDGTGFPEQGTHSVGVARQSRGMLGKQDSGQVADGVSLAAQGGSLPVAWPLNLPKEWSGDEARRTKAGVPNGIEFTTRPAIALAQIERLLSQRAPWHCVLADAGQGAETAFQGQRTARGLAYVVGVTTQVNVWPPGHAPLPPLPHSGRGNAHPPAIGAGGPRAARVDEGIGQGAAGRARSECRLARGKMYRPSQTGRGSRRCGVQHRLPQHPVGNIWVRKARVTTRSATAHGPTIRTLMGWQIEVDPSMLLGRLAKGALLREFEPDVICDDQTGDVDNARDHMPAAQVAHGVSNPGQHARFRTAAWPCAGTAA